jgi:hypothetical protein
LAVNGCATCCLNLQKSHAYSMAWIDTLAIAVIGVRIAWWSRRDVIGRTRLISLIV